MTEAADGHNAGTYTRALGEYIAASRTEPVPADVGERVKLLVLDTIGCGLLGSRMPWTQRLVETIAATESPGKALVWGTHYRFSATNAALANGTSVHGFEIDDVGAGGHNGSVTLTAALALAECGASLSGAGLIRAIVTGVEVAERVKRCTRNIPHAQIGFHGPGLWGTFAAMATSCVVLGLEAEQAVNAIGHAAQQAGGLMGTHHGGMGKRLLQGKAAHAGVFAAQLAAHGFTNVDNIFECGYGSFPSAFCGARDSFTLDLLTEGLGESFLSRGINFKLWSCRVPIHPSLEAVKALRAQHPLPPEQIDRVIVELPEASYRAVGFPYRPTTIASAQLNLQYCLAIMLLENDVFVEQFTEEKIAAPRVLDMVRRIEVVYRPDLDAAAGGLVSPVTQIAVVLKDGRRLAQTGRTRGTADDPVTRAEIVAKFAKTTDGVFERASAERLIALCDGLDQLSDAREVLKLLGAPASPVSA